MNNWIPDVNKFNLPAPPVWWLNKLKEFDPSLVVITSRQDFVYRLAQRRKLNLPDHIVNDAFFNQSDTRMLASYGLVPVTSIMPNANWSNPYLFVELANRAPWRHGGAEKVTNALEAREAEEQDKVKAKTDEMLTEVAQNAWKYYKHKLVK